MFQLSLRIMDIISSSMLETEALSKISLETSIINLLLASYKTKCKGLFYGKMGSAIVLFYLQKTKSNYNFYLAANDLLEKSLVGLYENSDLSLQRGLAGICWGIEFLHMSQVIKCNPDYVCRDIISRIHTIDPKQIAEYSLDSFVGLLYYLDIHLFNCINDNRRSSFKRGFLNVFAETCKKNHKQIEKVYSSLRCMYLYKYLCKENPFKKYEYAPSYLSSFVQEWKHVEKGDVGSGLLSKDAYNILK